MLFRSLNSTNSYTRQSSLRNTPIFTPQQDYFLKNKIKYTPPGVHVSNTFENTDDYYQYKTNQPHFKPHENAIRVADMSQSVSDSSEYGKSLREYSIALHRAHRQKDEFAFIWPKTALVFLPTTCKWWPPLYKWWFPESVLTRLSADRHYTKPVLTSKSQQINKVDLNRDPDGIHFSKSQMSNMIEFRRGVAKNLVSLGEIHADLNRLVNDENPVLKSLGVSDKMDPNALQLLLNFLNFGVAGKAHLDNNLLFPKTSGNQELSVHGYIDNPKTVNLDSPGRIMVSADPVDVRRKEILSKSGGYISHGALDGNQVFSIEGDSNEIGHITENAENLPDRITGEHTRVIANTAENRSDILNSGPLQTTGDSVVMKDNDFVMPPSNDTPRYTVVNHSRQDTSSDSLALYPSREYHVDNMKPRRNYGVYDFVRPKLLSYADNHVIAKDKYQESLMNREWGDVDESSKESVSEELRMDMVYKRIKRDKIKIREEKLADLEQQGLNSNYQLIDSNRIDNSVNTPMQLTNTHSINLITDNSTQLPSPDSPPPSLGTSIQMTSHSSIHSSFDNPMQLSGTYSTTDNSIQLTNQSTLLKTQNSPRRTLQKSKLEHYDEIMGELPNVHFNNEIIKRNSSEEISGLDDPLSSHPDPYYSQLSIYNQKRLNNYLIDSAGNFHGSLWGPKTNADPPLEVEIGYSHPDWAIRRGRRSFYGYAESDDFIDESITSNMKHVDPISTLNLLKICHSDHDHFWSFLLGLRGYQIDIFQTIIAEEKERELQYLKDHVHYTSGGEKSLEDLNNLEQYQLTSKSHETRKIVFPNIRIARAGEQSIFNLKEIKGHLSCLNVHYPPYPQVKNLSKQANYLKNHAGKNELYYRSDVEEENYIARKFYTKNENLSKAQIEVHRVVRPSFTRKSWEFLVEDGEIHIVSEYRDLMMDMVFSILGGENNDFCEKFRPIANSHWPFFVRVVENDREVDKFYDEIEANFENLKDFNISMASTEYRPFGDEYVGRCFDEDRVIDYDENHPNKISDWWQIIPDFSDIPVTTAKRLKRPIPSLSRHILEKRQKIAANRLMKSNRNLYGREVFSDHPEIAKSLKYQRYYASFKKVIRGVDILNNPYLQSLSIEQRQSRLALRIWEESAQGKMEIEMKEKLKIAETRAIANGYIKRMRNDVFVKDNKCMLSGGFDSLEPSSLKNNDSSTIRQIESTDIVPSTIRQIEASDTVPSTLRKIDGSSDTVPSTTGEISASSDIVPSTIASSENNVISTSSSNIEYLNIDEALQSLLDDNNMSEGLLEPHVKAKMHSRGFKGRRRLNEYLTRVNKENYVIPEKIALEMRDKLK